MKLEITMNDGSVFHLGANMIALNRANYYSAKESTGEDKERVQQEEYKITLDDPDELIDWAKNNMNWSDVSLFAKLVKSPDECDYQDGWVNGKMRVI